MKAPPRDGPSAAALPTDRFVKTGTILIAGALLSLLLPGPARAAEGIGAYFTLVNTYLYADGPQAGRRILARPRMAFRAVDVTIDNRERIWYRVILPARTRKVSGLGWTPNAPHELVASNENPVLVFSRIPRNGNSAFQSLRVPPAGIELLNETRSDSPFDQVVWQKVRYRLERPLRLWAREGAGIYRAGRTPQYFTRVYGELVTRGIPKDEQVRVLSGLIRIGDTIRTVRWALGDPLREQEQTAGDARRTIWQFREFRVVFENDVVKQID